MGTNVAMRSSLLLVAMSLAGIGKPAFAASAGAELPIFLDGFETGCAQLVGLPCDGSDTDLCTTGVYSCVNDTPVCSDDAVSTIDVCNGLDDDCDVASADGSEDPLIGGQCDGGDTDMCTEGFQQCVTGAPVCSDTSGNNVEVCNGQDDDCDTLFDEGTRDTNPVCDDRTDLGSFSGDSGNAVLMQSGVEERWYRFRLTENDGSPGGVYLSATIFLTSPPGADFDLFVYCLTCGGTQAGSSTATSLAGHQDSVTVRADDETFQQDDFDVLVEIRYKSGTSCSVWNLSISGNTPAIAATCP